MSDRAPVLVVGAGTTGLAMACELARHGAQVRIVDKLGGIDPHCRATSLHARTLEIFHDFGIVDEVVARGVTILGMSQYANGTRFMQSNAEDCGSPYSFTISLDQCRTEAILERLLESYGVKVEREVELLSTSQRPERVAAGILRADGSEETIEASWLVACDGAHSRVRHLNRMHFPGDEDPHHYMIGDVMLDADLARDEISVFLSDHGSFMAIPLPDERWLVAGDVPADRESRSEPKLDEVREMARQRVGPGMAIEIRRANWLTYFRINYRTARHYRHGRIFLAGDAVHIHSPMGGQGMNTGIQDAYNLAWKLALVWRGLAPDALLDSYEKERRPVAEDVIKVTRMVTERMEAFQALPPERRASLYINAVIPPEVAHQAARHNEELDLSYAKSPICHQHHPGADTFTAAPHPGEQAPDAKPLLLDGESTTLFDLMRGPRHVMLMFPGTHHEPASWRRLAKLADSVEHTMPGWAAAYLVATDLTHVSASCGAKVILDQTRALHDRYGVERECLYLIRPDGYVGYRSSPATESALFDYLKRILLL